ncbi:GSU2403 family nucleotidyltransferase fold protein [Labrys wisconsinensis]|uniref:Nucleotidyltransferase-like domain-containing protein n=1 Tax=Labrys wisconsinensis TaxID=425677 RepID=A0ABU0J8E5_9HYPH|nr:GSU2403 family nucleotidyltransferase fold protein [Labrys wisconsinensis]MDQ0470544.1 hypothetical protein [Labrys wisconsinensis]
MAPTPIPGTVLTLYADLVQKIEAARYLPATISRKTVKGEVYLYADEKHGGTRRQRYIGPQIDPEAAKEAEQIQFTSQQAKLWRDQVTMIRRAGIPGPSLEVGRLLEAISRSGMFGTGLILVGTVAFGLYPLVVGKRLRGAAMMTQDADLAVASIADVRGDADLTTVLQRADPTFRPVPPLDRESLPKKFQAASGFEVEVLTPVRTRADVENVAVKGLGAGATPLHFLEFLIRDSMRAVALYNSGVPVTIPTPARYAVHKLIIAQERRNGTMKRIKDLAQARILRDAFVGTEHAFDWQALMEDVTARGGKWKANVDRSLRMLDAGVGMAEFT